MTNKEEVIKTLENSPYWSLLGLKVKKLEEGWAEIYLPVTGELMQMFTIMHGGAAASLLDAAGAVALFNWIDPQKEAVATVELKINYLKPVTREETGITARGEVIKKGRSISVCQVDISSDSDSHVAVGIGTYTITTR